MGRRPIEGKERIDNQALKREWVKRLSEIYLRQGFRNHSMEDIASHLGISKATLYKYFSSRLEMLEEIVRLKLEELSIIEKYLNDEQLSFYNRYFQAIQSASMLMAGISNQFLLEVKQLHPDLWVDIKRFQDFALEQTKQFYQKGIEQGYLRPLDAHFLAVSDKIFIRSVSDPNFLIENNLELKSAFENYFLMKSQGIFEKK